MSDQTPRSPDRAALKPLIECFEECMAVSGDLPDHYSLLSANGKKLTKGIVRAALDTLQDIVREQEPSPRGWRK